MPRSANKPLLILSTFAPSEQNKLWYDLQRRYIAKTTVVPYEYRLYLNGVSPEGFEPSHVLHHSEKNAGHEKALAYLLAYSRQQDYDHYLFLDSDCFPVGGNWYAILTGQMQGFDKTIAAPVRVENLDLFPHPCAVFISRAGIDDERIDFRSDLSAKNMLGIEVQDVGTAMSGMDRFMPLLRTNVVNIDPVAAAVYHHIFYHHGAGSRMFTFRITNRYKYYDHWWNKNDTEKTSARLLNELANDPDRLLNLLMRGERPGAIRSMLRFFLRNTRKPPPNP